MAVRHIARGQIDGPWYFINAVGRILLPMDYENARFLEPTMSKRGYRLEQVRTLHDWLRIERIIRAQDRLEIESEIYREQCGPVAQKRADVRSRLYTRLASSHTSEYEKDFIREWLSVREDKREKYISKLAEVQTYFELLNYDKPVHVQELVDRIEVGGKR